MAVAIRRNGVTELFWRAHTAVFRLTGGRIGGKMMGMPVLLLTTTGRRSKTPRTVALMHVEDGPRFVVIASNAGEDRHPAWWLNLQADPVATVERRDTTTRVRAREATGEERERLWARAVAIYDGYTAYAARTRRHIPVVVLEPVAS